MNSRELMRWIAAICEIEQSHNGRENASLPDHLPESIERIQEFRDAGIFSSTDGLIVRMENGDEFQIVVAQTSYASTPMRRLLHTHQ